MTLTMSTYERLFCIAEEGQPKCLSVTNSLNGFWGGVGWGGGNVASRLFVFMLV